MTRTSEVAPAWSAEVEPSELTKLLASGDAKAEGARHAGRTRKLGLLTIFVLLWVSVAQSEASQALQAASRFNKPFFIVGFDHTITVLLLPLVYLYHRFADPETRRLAQTDGLSIVALLQRHSVVPLRKLLPMAAFLNAFYCFADYFWYAALANVSVAASTAIFNCSPFFVYCFSICFLRERASYQKLAGVLMSFVGVALIALFQDGSAPLDPSTLNDDDGESSLLASVLVVISAAIYGAYEVAFCVVLGDELEDTSTLLILTGLCGLLSIPLWILGSFLFSWCPIEALHEPLGWPVGGEAITMLVLSGTLAGAYTLLLSLALCWTTPLETAVGCMLTIPLAGIWDMVINGTVFSWECVLGSFLVMAGFGVLECCSPKPKVDVGNHLSSVEAKVV